MASFAQNSKDLNWGASQRLHTASLSATALWSACIFWARQPEGQCSFLVVAVISLYSSQNGEAFGLLSKWVKVAILHRYITSKIFCNNTSILLILIGKGAICSNLCLPLGRISCLGIVHTSGLLEIHWGSRLPHFVFYIPLSGPMHLSKVF